MAEFKVVFEIEVESTNPIEAAKEVRNWLKGEEGFIFYVQDDETKEIFSVDLDEYEEDENENALLLVTDYKPMIS